jgi:hypothetical protein
VYEWRKMSPSQRAAKLRIRRQSGKPWHSPPHPDLEGDRVFFVAIERSESTLQLDR